MRPLDAGTKYWTHLKDAIDNERLIHGRTRFEAESSFRGVTQTGAFQTILLLAQTDFVSENFFVEDGVALNAGLSESLFVATICVLNHLPLFIVGKPGTSKTLTLSVLESNMQGAQSHRAFFTQFPRLHLVQYQCSPLSSSEAIQHQYDAACRYQQQSNNVLSLLLLDEVGLAEHSPNLPLKVLHSILLSPPIAIIGISNWVLDPAKMNRAVCLQRVEPTAIDMELTAQSILRGQGLQAWAPIHETSDVGSGDGASCSDDRVPPIPQRQPSFGRSWLQPVSQAFHSLYSKQHGRDFIGMRDYYALVKSLRLALVRDGGQLQASSVVDAIARNFGGERHGLERVLEEFRQELPHLDEELRPSPVQELVRANLHDGDCRHLMLLTTQAAALQLLFVCSILRESDAEVLIGSEFPEDLSELSLVQSVNRIKLAMASGRTVVLVNHDNVYEAMYDVLNQRHLAVRDSKTGQTRRMLRLAIGSRSQLCPVHESFKVVVIVEAEQAYSRLDLPLLNRFEVTQLLRTQNPRILSSHPSRAHSSVASLPTFRRSKYLRTPKCAAICTNASLHSCKNGLSW